MPEPSLKDLSPEQLDAMMRTGDFTPPAPEPVQAEAPEAVPDAPLAVEPTQPEPPAPAPAAEPAPDKLKEAQAHAGRLAGEIGYLRAQLAKAHAAANPPAPQEAAPAPEVPEAPAPEETEADMQARWDAETAAQEQDALSAAKAYEAEQAAASERAKQAHAAAAEVMARGASAVEGVPVDFCQQVGARHAEEWNPAIQELAMIADPELARARAEVIASTIARTINQEFAAANREALLMQREASTAANLKAKRAATISGGGGSSAPPVAPRTPAQMSIDEADRWLREHMQ